MIGYGKWTIESVDRILPILIIITSIRKTIKQNNKHLVRTAIYAVKRIDKSILNEN